ncbi:MULTISPECIES: hypothetical protein [Streptomyces]|uniref:Uncharacterized protein n=1 Tax=Streptomyces venezuelae (strain ATCC 10712 / CBS 650.69 / DSM 40230 / JCM 4526 / NBRC 13096 / PD 04745) TaxID=953739 RepID=F2RAE1_STRVP|nr:hypothetical protein [Streptomyces venezuelae]APE22441.1 hypothetical protein vnz_16440 [Streptomyces venezuelae]QER99823.1 hypothetical protein DEJ43_16645 [Streptomyces venezuelae ATCC 10712]QES06866.1 hypothetical protein DEJ44_15450 [Streptomyces venezuelae]QES14410.1 hypothetical protein DEJ45_19775 [Streptomyces venezuelae]CCA56623.1 hypothetical protein SVEN_3337 [Streptomyces venezuelae ATCC 10712]
MGWTHDYGDTTARNRRSAAGQRSPEGAGPPDQSAAHGGQEVGISRILRRRARWVSARLRHPRDTP